MSNKFELGTEVFRNDGNYGSTYGTIIERYDDDSYILRVWDGSRHVGDVVAIERELSLVDPDPETTQYTARKMQEEY